MKFIQRNKVRYEKFKALINYFSRFSFFTFSSKYYLNLFYEGFNFVKNNHSKHYYYINHRIAHLNNKVNLDYSKNKTILVELIKLDSICLKENYFGNFINFFNARNNFKYHLSEGKYIPYRYIEKHIQALIEDNLIKEVQIFFEKRPILKKRFHDLFQFSQLIKTNPITQPLIKDSFQKKIFNKKIAIIGGAPLSHSELIEISKFDFVAITNPVTLNVNNLNLHNKIIAYFNNQRGLSSARNIIENFQTFSAISFRSKVVRNYVMNKGGLDKDFLRVMNNADKLLFNANSSNAIPSIAYDIMLRAPSQIKVFGVNFYCSNKVFREGYKEFASIEKIALAIRGHDPFSGYNFIKNLYINKVLSLDKAAKKIIEMDETQYAKKIDSIYGKFTY